MSTKNIDPLHWFGSAFTASTVLCLFSMVATFFIKTDSTALGIFFWQVILGFSYTPAILVCSIPLTWVTWRLIKNYQLSRVFSALAVGVSGALLVAASNLPYFVSVHLLPVPYDLLVVTAGVALNIAAFLWLSSPPNPSFKRDLLKQAP